MTDDDRVKDILMSFATAGPGCQIKVLVERIQHHFGEIKKASGSSLAGNDEGGGGQSSTETH